MPAGDGTGPFGMGPMTGRAAGYCAGYSVPGYMNPMPGRAFGPWGRGGRRGWRHWFYATGLPGWQRAARGWPAWGMGWAPPIGVPPSREEQIKALREEAENLEHALEEIRKRIQDLEATKSVER